MKRLVDAARFTDAAVPMCTKLMGLQPQNLELDDHGTENGNITNHTKTETSLNLSIPLISNMAFVTPHVHCSWR
jgi:hypothetical protein